MKKTHFGLWLTLALLAACGSGFAETLSAGRHYDLICKMYGEGAGRDAALLETQKFLDAFPSMKYGKHSSEPCQPRYRASVGYIRALCLGNTQEAIGVFGRLASENKGTELGVSALYMKGQCYYNQRLYPEAQRCFEEILDRYPRDFLVRETLYGLLQTQIALNNYNDADATLARLLKRDPYYEKQDKVIIASGLLLYHKGKFAEAYDKFSVLKSTQALYYQGKSLEQMQKYIQALVVFKQLLTQYPECEYREEVFFRIAECFYRATDYASAVIEYNKFIESFPESSYKENAFYKIGCCHFQKKEYAEAIVAFKNLIQDFPDKEFAPLAQYMIGESFLVQDNLSEAINAYGEVISNYPASAEVLPYAYYKIGWCYTKQESPDAAIGMFTQFVTKFATHDYVPYSLMLIAENHLKNNNPDQAVACYKQVLDRSDRTAELTEVALFMITKIYYTARRYNDIISNYHYILNNLTPSSSEWRSYTFLMVAEAYYYLGLFTESEKVYDLVSRNYPYSQSASLAQDGKSWVHFQVKEYDLAQKERQSFMEDMTVEHSSTTRISSEFEMGNIYYNQKKYVEALDVFEKFIQEHPNEQAMIPEALYSIGRCYYKLEYYSRAIQTWEKLLASYRDHPRSQEAMNLIADTYFRAQKYGEAVQAYGRIIATYPDTDMAKQAQLRIAQSYYNAMDDRKAIEEFEKFLNAYSEDPMGENALEGIMMSSYRLSESGGDSGLDLQVLQKFVDKYPKSKLASTIQYRLAERYYEKKDYPKAAEEYRKVFSNFASGEHVADAHFYMAESYYLATNYTEAVGAYRRFIANFPQHESARIAYLHLANSLYYQQQFVDAAQVYQDLTKMSKTEDEIAVTALLNTALCYKKASKWEEAALVYEQFVKTFPENKMVPNVLTELAGVYEILKRYDQATATYSQLLQKTTNDASKAEMQYKIAEFCLKQDKTQQAMEEFAKLYSFQPSGDPWRLSGIARLAQEYENQKDWAKATEAYQEIMRSARETKWITAAQERLKAIEAAQQQQ